MYSSWAKGRKAFRLTTIYLKLGKPRTVPCFNCASIGLELVRLFWWWSGATCRRKTHKDFEAVVDTPFYWYC